MQQAVVKVLSAIYEGDFLRFSYGFRQRRGQHNALDALMVEIKSQRVNWILDADIGSFFDDIDHDWMLRFLEHRIADQRVPSMIREWLKASVIENGCRNNLNKGRSARICDIAHAGEYLSALRLRSVGSALA